MDAAQLGDFNKGNTVSQTAKRTQFRGVRRLYERKKAQKRKIASHPTIIRISSKALCQPIRQVWKVYSQFRAQKLAWTTNTHEPSYFIFQRLVPRDAQ